MTAASDLVPKISEITGFSPATVNGVKRRLIETGDWPASRGSIIPDLNTRHVVIMLLALMADVPAKDAASAANAYYSLAHPNGTFLGDVMVKMINSFKNYSAVSLLAKTAFKTRIEIDTDYPRACLSIECKDAEAQVEIMYGVQTPIWGNIRVRRAITIGGKALFDIAMGLHHNRWPGDDSIGI